MLHRHLYLRVFVGELLNIRLVSANLELIVDSQVGARFQKWQASRDIELTRTVIIAIQIALVKKVNL